LIEVDCSELTGDEKLALASAFSESLEGSGLALIKGDNIVVDQLTSRRIEAERIVSIIREFTSKRKQSSLYSVEVDGDTIVVHSPDPIAALRKKATNGLPPNVLQCPACGFITSSQEKYDFHLRSHDILRGLGR
jgi:hypothetical protein